MVRSFARNLQLYPWYLCLTWEGISNAVWYLYLFSFKGMSLGQMAWLILLGDGIIVLTEVPTGWVADRIGRRRSILLGIFLQALSAILFIAGNDFWTFWLAMAICGLGDTFRSGADEALLYDSCRALKRTADYRRILARSMVIGTLAMVAGQLLGGVLATRIGWTVPFWCEVAMSAAGFMVVYQMLEAPYRDDPKDKQVAKYKGVPLLASLGRMLPVMLFAALLDLSPELSHFHLPAELDTDLGITPEKLGFMYAAFELMHGFGNWLASRVRISHPQRLFIWIGIAMIMGLIVMGSRAWLGLAAYLAGRAMIDMLDGYSSPLISEYANKLSESSVRATSLSILNASRRVLPLSLLPLSASLMIGIGPAGSYLLFAAAMILPMLFVNFWLMRQVNTSSSGNIPASGSM